MVASTVAAASSLKKGEAAGEPNKVRGRTYVVTCPPIKEDFELLVG